MAIHPRWLFGVLLRYASRTGVPTYAHYPLEFKTRITRSALRVRSGRHRRVLARPGKQAAADVLAILRDELERALAFLGMPHARKLSGNDLVPRPVAQASSMVGRFAVRDPDRRNQDDEAAGQRRLRQPVAEE